ncbi:MAG TPA: hypothetical protein VFW00_07065, partial [Rhodocyclaceae bacterium]|nr:hypothetical protein [Rhodocyclaceae bacterium]
MTISDAQYAAWLDDPTAQRVTLYRIGCISGGTQITRYLSNTAYGGGSSATPYLAIIAKDLEIAQSISIDSTPRLSAGDIQIHNLHGEYDSWRNDIWANQSALAYVGDVRWAEADFRLQAVCTVADIKEEGDRKLIAFEFRDAMQRLNTPVSEAKMTNGVLYPIALGEVPNMTPKYDSVSGKWYYHNGPVEGLIEPRTDGKRRSSDVTDDVANGRFGFNNAVGPGILTCSVQGDKTGGTYRNTIASLVQLLATSYGKASTRMTTGDIDTANFSAFDSANPQPVGLPILDRTNVIDAIAKLASSKGAQVLPSMLGKLRILQYAIPTTATLNIPRSMQVRRSLTPVTRSKVQAAVQIGFCRNYTVEPNLQTSLPPEHKQMFAQEWQLYTTPVDTTTQAAYSLFADPTMEETCLLTFADAQTEGLRRQSIKKVPHTTYRMELLPAGLLVQLGEARNLFDDRFGMQSGLP